MNELEDNYNNYNCCESKTPKKTDKEVIEELTKENERLKHERLIAIGEASDARNRLKEMLNKLNKATLIEMLIEETVKE